MTKTDYAAWMSKRQHPVINGIKWILENRKRADGSSWTPDSFAIYAGLSHASIDSILNRQDPDNVRSTTLVKIARAGNVSLHWLHTGEGPREPFEVAGTSYPELDENEAKSGARIQEPSPPSSRPATRTVHPTLSQFKIVARKEGADETLLDALDYEVVDEPTFDTWQARYLELVDQRDRFRLALTPPTGMATTKRKR